MMDEYFIDSEVPEAEKGANTYQEDINHSDRGRIEGDIEYSKKGEEDRELEW